MSQPSALPGALSPEAVQLIDGQYADRPHLRPVLDAVLAAVPSLGAVTVEARKTLVSLVTPRRTFAIVQATTKNRVDLGLRLTEPGAPAAGARLQPARNLGPASVRIGLTEPAEFDDEARGLLRLAYAQNTDFGGPFVRGDRTDRHLGIAWGDVSADGTFRLIRGSKLKLADVDPALVAEAMRPGSRLVARIHLADARVHPGLVWSVDHP